MSKPILLLRLEGPLQSWGTRSRWDVRDTATEPTKSGIIGLLGCALGYPSGSPQLEELDRALRFGVRIEHAGTLATDYQTITDFLPTAAGQWKSRGGTKSLEAIRREGDAPATIISPRTYLEDAAFLVGLEAWNNDQLLTECGLAVKQPRWPLFLGRKACVPTRPIFEYCDTDYASLEEAFERHHWQWLGACQQLRTKLPEKRLLAYLEDPAGNLVRQDSIRVNTSRTYAFRNATEKTFQPVGPDSEVQP